MFVSASGDASWCQWLSVPVVRVGFWTPKTCFFQGSGKNLRKAVFPGFMTVFTAQNWEKPDLLDDVSFR